MTTSHVPGTGDNDEGSLLSGRRPNRGSRIFRACQVRNLDPAESGDSPPYHRWSGMSNVIDEIRDAVDFDKTFKGRVNGWAIMAVVLGVDEVSHRMSDNLNLVVLVCALLISTSLTLAYTAPPTFTYSDSIDNQLKNCYIAFVTIAIGCHFTCIICASLYCQALNTFVRDADKWRLIIHTDYVPTLIYTVFTLGNMSITLEIAFAIQSYYDVGAYLFSGLLIFVCGALMHYMNAQHFIKQSHVVHGWYKRRKDEYDIQIPFTKLERLVEYEQNMRSCEEVSIEK